MGRRLGWEARVGGSWGGYSYQRRPPDSGVVALKGPNMVDLGGWIEDEVEALSLRYGNINSR